jgi:hypothetical protein
MAYYNGFPATYQPMYQQPYQQTQQQMNSNLIWVQGEAGAKSYLVAPNTTVPLWDSEAQKIYLKSADVSGMPSIKTLEYTIVGGANNAVVDGKDPNKIWPVMDELMTATYVYNKPLYDATMRRLQN